MVRETVGFGGSGAWDGTVQSDGKTLIVGGDYTCGSAGFRERPMVVRHEPDGRLDEGFGLGGISRFDLPGTENLLIAVAEADDHKIVIAGKHVDASGDDILVVRLEPDGALDTSFGSGGYAVFDAGGDEIAVDVVVHPDGRISVVGGYASDAVEDVLVVRFDPDGGLDSSFGGGSGHVITSINIGTEQAFGVALQEDGKLVVVGHTDGDAFVARYVADGDLDTGFASGGINVTHFGGDDWLLGVALQRDDKIVVTGTVFPFAGGAEAVVARYLGNGAIDTGFAGSGASLFSFGSGDRGLDVALQVDGRILVLNGVGLSGYEQISAFRLASNGTLDTTYGSSGIALPMNHALSSTPASIGVLPGGGSVLMGSIIRPSTLLSGFVAVALDDSGAAEPGFGDGGVAETFLREGSSDYGMDVAVAPDGRIFTAVTTETPAQCLASQPREMAVTSHFFDGSLDFGFGLDGIADLTESATTAQVEAMALRPDGKILLAGSGLNIIDQDFRIVRLLPNGDPDPDFGTEGRVYVPIGSSDDYAMGIALQPDGKIVVAGRATGVTQDDIAIVRLLEDGSLDSSFGAGGVVQTDVGSGSNDWAADVVLQLDGKIVVGGSSDGAFVLLRYTSSGGLDASFGSGGVVTRSVGTVSDTMGAVLVDVDGNVVAVGTANDGGITGRHGVVLRYVGDGSPDPGFAGNGLLAPEEWGSLVFRDATILPSHRIAIAGYTEFNPDMVLVSVLHHGEPDRKFGANGYVRLDSGAVDFGEAIAQDTEGRIILAGRVQDGDELDLLLAAAFSPDATDVPALDLWAHVVVVGLLLVAAAWWSRRSSMLRA